MSRPHELFPALTLACVLGFALAPVGCSKTKIELPTIKLDAATLVDTISHGASVDLKDHLEPGIWTLLEFTADW